MTIRLYEFWHSSAAYRVRIALNLKGLTYESVQTNLVEGAHKSPDYLAKNPQGLVPMLEIDGLHLTQTLAIMEYLDTHSPVPAFVPHDPVAKSRVMAMSLIIATDIHPINNLRILKYLKNVLGQEQAAIDAWYRHWIGEGFTALEAMADPAIPFLCGDAPGLADICLVPQMYNARRFETPLDAYPNLLRIDAACTGLPAFAAAHPYAVKP